MSREKTFRRNYLAAAIAALGTPAAAAEAPPWVADGVRINVDAGDYETRANSVYGIWLRNKGSAFGSGVRIDTYGKDSSAVHIQGTGKADGELRLTGGVLHTRGDSANGLYVGSSENGSTTLTDVAIVTEGAGARGVYVNQGKTPVELLGGSISTNGRLGIGVNAENGGALKMHDVRVTTVGEAAAGVLLSGANVILDLKQGSIQTRGNGSHGMYVTDNSRATLQAPDITTEGESSTVIRVGEAGSVNIIGGRLQSTGVLSSGIYASHEAIVWLSSDTRLETTGNSAVGVDNRAGNVSVDGSTVVTSGRRSHALLSQGGDYPGAIPRSKATRATIATGGSEAYGAYALAGGRINLMDSTLATAGDSAHGLVASGGSANTTDSLIEATNTVIQTTGKSAYGAVVQYGGNLDIYGGSISSAHAAALALDDPGRISIGGGALLSGGDGAFAEVDAGSSKAFTIELDGGARAIGDIRVAAAPGTPPPDATKASLRLMNNATWRGATSIVRDLSVESGATWAITGDSLVGRLTNSRGVIDFAPIAANRFATLTVAGNYDGNGGLLRMRSQLGGDASPSDLLHVMGDTSGSTRIAVDALDGAGDQTRDGIRLVRVDGQSAGDFELAGRAVAGPYEYFLHKGALGMPNDGGWYLRSTREPDPIVEPEIDPIDLTPEPPLTPEPEGEVAPVPVVERLLRPEVGTYRANQTAALEMFQGGPGAGEDDERTGARQHVWARFDRRHTSFDIGDQLTTTSSASELTIGADLFHDPDSDAHVGVMAATARADTRGTSLLTHYAARGRVRGSAGGIYGGFRADAGTFVRGWAQYGHVNQRVEGDALGMERYGSGILTASMEAGHRWRHALNRDTDTYIEPQAQILATRLSGGNHVETAGTRIAPRGASGATARLGIRTAARWSTPNGHVASPYFAANWIRRLGRLDATAFNGEAFNAGMPRNSYALKLGVALLRNSGWSAWTDVETRFGAQRYRRVTGSIGLRKSW